MNPLDSWEFKFALGASAVIVVAYLLVIWLAKPWRKE